MVPALDKGEKGRRVECVEATEKGEGIAVKRDLEALGKIDLVNVTGGDVVDDAPDGVLVSGLVKVGPAPGIRQPEGVRCGPGSGAGIVKPLHKPVLSLRRVRAQRHQESGAHGLFVLHHQQGGRVKQHVGQAHIIDAGARQDLKIVFQIVGQVAHQPRRQGRWPLAFGQPNGFEDVAQHIERCVIDHLPASIHLQTHLPGASGNGQPGPDAQQVMAGAIEVAAAEQGHRTGQMGKTGAQIHERFAQVQGFGMDAVQRTDLQGQFMARFFVHAVFSKDRV